MTPKHPETGRPIMVVLFMPGVFDTQHDWWGWMVVGRGRFRMGRPFHINGPLSAANEE